MCWNRIEATASDAIENIEGIRRWMNERFVVGWHQDGLRVYEIKMGLVHQPRLHGVVQCEGTPPRNLLVYPRLYFKGD